MSEPRDCNRARGLLFDAHPQSNELTKRKTLTSEKLGQRQKSVKRVVGGVGVEAERMPAKWRPSVNNARRHCYEDRSNRRQNNVKKCVFCAQPNRLSVMPFTHRKQQARSVWDLLPDLVQCPLNLHRATQEGGIFWLPCFGLDFSEDFSALHE